MNTMSYYQRTVNNHKHVHRAVEVVGNYISAHQISTVPEKTPFAKELICQVDGGHLKSKEKNSRSFEAITSVMFFPLLTDNPNMDWILSTLGKRRALTSIFDSTIQASIKSLESARSRIV